MQHPPTAPAARPPTRRAAIRARARIRDYTERVAALQQQQLPLPDNDPLFNEFGFLESDPEDDDYDPDLLESDSDSGSDDDSDDDDESDDDDSISDEDEDEGETDDMTEDEDEDEDEEE